MLAHKLFPALTCAEARITGRVPCLNKVLWSALYAWLRPVSPQSLIFGAILHRDSVHQSILDQGMILGLPWGTDPDNVEDTPTPQGDRQNDPSNKDS